jgi:hypothetical protein
VVRSLAERAVARNSPYSDNTSVAAVRWHGDGAAPARKT